LAGRLAVVTGGSRGIGAAIAERLARDGATIVMTYNRGRDRADAVVKSIQQAGGNARAVRADASSFRIMRR
jgi:3-oxoacyl-[acyl-carrier protein] reductase